MTTPSNNALRWPPFLQYYCCLGLSTLGHWMLRLTLGWMAWNLSGSTFWTSLVVTGLLLPSSFISPFVAVFVENWPIRLAARWVNLATILCTFGLWLVAATSGHTLYSLVGFTFALGIAQATYAPIRLVFITVLVPKRYLPSAIGLNAAMFNAGRLIGPALSGTLLILLGVENTLLISATALVPLQFAFWLLKTRKRLQKPTPPANYLHRLADGFTMTLKDDSIKYVMGATAFGGVFIGVVSEIQPALVGALLGGDVHQLAIAASATGSGALTASLIFGSGLVPPQTIRRIILPVAMTAMLAIITLPALHQLTTLAALFIVVGFATTSIGIMSQTLIQLQVDENYRARVLSWWSILIHGGLSLSGLTIGALGEWLPIQNVLAGSAAVGLILAFAWWQKFPTSPRAS